MHCKFCTFSHHNKETLLKHHRIHHNHVGVRWPCFYDDCGCSFRTSGSLRCHLSKCHTKTQKHAQNTTFSCDLCDFRDVCDEKQIFSHLGLHLRSHQTVRCPFINCEFRTNVPSTFSSHRSRSHKHHTVKDLRTVEGAAETETVDEEAVEQTACNEHIPSTSCTVNDCEDRVDPPSLEHKLASLFLGMQTVLHISRQATQRIIEELNDLVHFSKAHALQNVKEVLNKYNQDINDNVVEEVTEAVLRANPLYESTKGKGPLATDYRRNNYYLGNFPVVQPVEYLYESISKKCFVYVPVLQMLDRLLCCKDVVGNINFTGETVAGVFQSFRDGQYFQSNELFREEESSFALAFYIDDFEICNPLGTSRNKHKVTAVYWVPLNLPAKFRSSLSSIQLAALGRSEDVKHYGFERFFAPLLRDISVLEKDGIYVEAKRHNVKGTIFCVCADNLAAHGLAGFQESFSVSNFCRFCVVSRETLQQTPRLDCQLRTPEQHNLLLKNKQGDTAVCGVKGECALSKHLTHFHPITGFPPDLLHDIFEGIVPVEMSLCLKELIRKGITSLDDINTSIVNFPYIHYDKVNKPHKIPKSSFLKGTAWGNGHENWTLLRLLPLMIGDRVPENEPAWEILMDLKDITEIVVSTKFSEASLNYLESKIADHRSLLLETFPDLRLRPKHHYLEHYPHLVRCFGPLVELWTMRFEAKHSFFKRVVHDTQNFKNILVTLAFKHQLMVAYHLDSNLFKHHIHAECVKVVAVASLDGSWREAFQRMCSHLNSVSLASDVQVDGIRYREGMVISAGQCGGLPEFYRIHRILVAENLGFLCIKLPSWYTEHVRSFELDVTRHAETDILTFEDLNDFYPLVAYSVRGKLLVSPKKFLIH